MLSVWYNDQLITAENIGAWKSLFHEPWELEIYQFLTEWFNPNQTQFEFTTSGTTGPPKKLFFSRAAMITSARQTLDTFQLKANDTILHALPAHFVAGKLQIVRAIVGNLKLYAVAPKIKLEASGTYDFIALTPPQLAACMQEPELISMIQNSKNTLIGGGTIPENWHSLLTPVADKIVQSYGMTETLTHVAVKKWGNAVYESVSKDIHFMIDDRSCLMIHAPYLPESPIITNDVVKLHDTHHFEWLGRWDHVINSGGLKIQPEQIEEHISSLVSSPFYVTSKTDEKWGEVPVLVLLKTQEKPSLEMLNRTLAKHLHIKAIVQVDAFAYTPTGKLIRQRIKN